jgi:hypothetical protein
MVICHLDLISVSALPPETYPVLDVYPDRVLSLSVSPQRFEAVARNLTQRI